MKPTFRLISAAGHDLDGMTMMERVAYRRRIRERDEAALEALYEERVAGPMRREAVIAAVLADEAKTAAKAEAARRNRVAEHARQQRELRAARAADASRKPATASARIKAVLASMTPEDRADLERRSAAARAHTERVLRESGAVSIKQSDLDAFRGRR